MNVYFQVGMEGGQERALGLLLLKSSVQLIIVSAHFKLHSPVFEETVAAFSNRGIGGN